MSKKGLFGGKDKYGKLPRGEEEDSLIDNKSNESSVKQDSRIKTQPHPKFTEAGLAKHNEVHKDSSGKRAGSPTSTASTSSGQSSWSFGGLFSSKKGEKLPTADHEKDEKKGNTP